MTIRFPIVKPVLPDISEYQKHIQSSFDRCWLTNSGPLLQELEVRLADYLGVENLMLVANGTLALQVAYKALEMHGPIATSPFSFAATASSVKWQNDQPYFVDIDPDSLNVCPGSLKQAISSAPSPISGFAGVHVFGNGEGVEAIEQLAADTGIKVVYDAAHAFAVNYKKQSLLRYGDASTLSLHATKIFHTVEGGAIVFRDKHVLEHARRLINFGFDNSGYPQDVGINAKMSEVHAAMGLALLSQVDQLLEHRQGLVRRYKHCLEGVVEFQSWSESCSENGAYMPVLFESEEQLLATTSFMQEQGVQTRRYFYPSLSEVKVYGQKGDTPVANGISRRIACLPMYAALTLADVETICDTLKQGMKQGR